MKKCLLSIVSFVFFIGAFAQKTFVNDANAEVRKLSGSFNNIKVSGGIDLYLSQYDQEAVAVSASSEEYTRNIKTIVENNTLRIFFEGGRTWNSGNKKLKVYVSFKQLEKLVASGACDVQVAGTIQMPSLKLDLNGASSFKGTIKVDDLSMELSGASDVKMQGFAAAVYIQSSGASDVKGYELVADVCTAKASGASDINITVNKELNATASGASDIYYKGQAIVKKMNSSGASSIVNKE